MNTTKLTRILSKEIGYNELLKKEFHSEGKKVLRALAKKLGLKASEFTITSIKSGIAVSGDVVLHTDSLYIHISQSPLTGDVMYRTCNGRKDFSGGPNNFTSADQLLENSFVHKLKSMSQKMAA